MKKRLLAGLLAAAMLTGLGSVVFAEGEETTPDADGAGDVTFTAKIGTHTDDLAGGKLYGKAVNEFYKDGKSILIEENWKEFNQIDTLNTGYFVPVVVEATGMPKDGEFTVKRYSASDEADKTNTVTDGHLTMVVRIAGTDGELLYQDGMAITITYNDKETELEPVSFADCIEIAQEKNYTLAITNKENLTVSPKSPLTLEATLQDEEGKAPTGEVVYNWVLGGTSDIVELTKEGVLSVKEGASIPENSKVTVKVTATVDGEAAGEEQTAEVTVQAEEEENPPVDTYVIEVTNAATVVAGEKLVLAATLKKDTAPVESATFAWELKESIEGVTLGEDGKTLEVADTVAAETAIVVVVKATVEEKVVGTEEFTITVKEGGGEVIEKDYKIEVTSAATVEQGGILTLAATVKEDGAALEQQPEITWAALRVSAWKEMS